MPDHIIGAALNSSGIPYQQLINAIGKEGDQLAQRIAAMTAFRQTDGFEVLDVLDKHLMGLQLENMQTYLHILTIRRARFDEARKGVLPKGAGALAKSPLIGGKPN